MFHRKSLLFQPELHTPSHGWDPWGSWKGAHSARIGIGPGSLLVCQTSRMVAEERTNPGQDLDSFPLFDDGIYGP